MEEDTLRLLDHGLEIMSREKMKAGIALTAGEKAIEDGTSCVFIYNPHPYEITGQFAFEAGLPKQNWEDVFYYPECSCNGEPVKTQGEMESSHFCIDWRKKVVIEATLKRMYEPDRYPFPCHSQEAGIPADFREKGVCI
ncbi:MAG: hypothetical protein ACLVAW_20265 [Eisenbergiella massiliensis]